MDREARVRELLGVLLAEEGKDPAALPGGYETQRKLLRGLLNKRPAVPMPEEDLTALDELLLDELKEKTVTDWRDIPPAPRNDRLALWQGDITTLRIPAIVNAANPRLLGCFHPLHNCIDNLIHSAAGFRLRLACQELMEQQGHEEPAGGVKLTPGFCLPAEFVPHAVGPQVKDGAVTADHRAALAACYRNALDLAQAHGISGVAFCCISTGCYGFPREEAAALAVETVEKYLPRCPAVERVVFNVFLDRDAVLYRPLLGWPD